MFAAAGMLLSTSCSSDEVDAVPSGDEAQVTFSLSREGGISSRAISDGLSAKKLVYAVYNANDAANPTLITTLTGSDTKNANNQFERANAFAGGLTDNVTLSLAKGQTYTVVFWAQNGECAAYNTDDLANVTVSYDSSANNDETRDAFFAAETFTVSGNASIDVTLKRPFAQINVGVTTDDWNAAVSSGTTITQSKVVISDAATAINLLTGAVSGSQEVTYTLADIPSGESLMVDADGDGVKEAYTWLSMSYILVNDGSEDGASKAAVDNLEFTFVPESGSNIIFSEGLNNVPVQRNWRTNILGQILSGNIKFNIKIDPAYIDDYNIFASVSDATGFADAVANEDIKIITLDADVTVPNSFRVESEKTIDLNNNALEINGLIQTHAPLVIENGTLNAPSVAVRSLDKASITLNNVTINTSSESSNAIELGYNRNGTVNCGDATLTISNSTINTGNTGILIHGANNTVVIENTKINHKWFGITQNGLIPGSNVKLVNTEISGTYSGVYLSNYADGAKNTLVVEGCNIHSDEESAIEVKKTDITVSGSTLSSSATTQSYSVNGGGSNGIGYGIVLAGYKTGVAYEGTTTFEGNTFNLAAQGDNVIKILKYNGTEGEAVE